MAAVPNESGFILEVPLKRYCAQVKGEQFAARLGNPAQFVVLELGRARPLVGAVGQVAGAVVAVAAFDGGLGITRRYFGFAFAAFRQVVEGGDLPFQTT